VADYLHTFTMPGQETFSLRDGDKTFDLYSKYAAQDHVHMGIWEGV